MSLSILYRMSLLILIAVDPSNAPSHCRRRRRRHRHHIFADPEIWGSTNGAIIALEASNGCLDLRVALLLMDGTNISASYGRTFVFQAVGYDEATNDAILLAVVPNHGFLRWMYGVYAYTACLRHPARRPFVRNVLPRQPQNSVVRREAQTTVARLDEERCRYSAEGANWLLLSGHLHVVDSGVDWIKRLHSALEQ
ncbi:hypothetical protein EKO27_g7632 [Xylaria grammica]|uniref:Uncharacterized protein n=1 Tax=Xylaria grammica TaxID=363999 RepID=A0A439CZ51_9PEZI|nr:hypothetical protein EKO27_g7632 [Xylaria grammica]